MKGVPQFHFLNINQHEMRKNEVLEGIPKNSVFKRKSMRECDVPGRLNEAKVAYSCSKKGVRTLKNMRKLIESEILKVFQNELK